jgi:hypothetical protein
MTWLSNLLTAIGVIILSFAAWIVGQVSESSQELDKNKIYLYCAAAFACILIGQIHSLRLTTALMNDTIKEPSFVERVSLQDFRTFSVRQGEYHKRAQAAFEKKSKAKK